MIREMTPQKQVSEKNNRRDQRRGCTEETQNSRRSPLAKTTTRAAKLRSKRGGVGETKKEGECKKKNPVVAALTILGTLNGPGTH